MLRLPPMNNSSAYGDKCGFCHTAVPVRATVCTGCGAYKGIRGDTQNGVSAFVRFGMWTSSVGFVLLLTFWGAVSSYQRGEIVLAVLWTAGGLFLTKICARVWTKIFGTLADPLWVRPH